MGDGLKLTKDKRHRSSSSLSGVVLDGTRSERKLEINASIPEVDDHFIVAETRCDDLQEKIDFIKSLKRKKKLRKRSMTKVMDQSQTLENVPFITVRTQPKKKVSPQAARLHRLEVPPNPTRGYLDPATLEQHRMIGQVRGYNNAFKQPNNTVQTVQERNKSKVTSKHPKSADLNKPYSKIQAMRRQRAQADGDSGYDQDVQISDAKPVEVACGDDEVCTGYYNEPHYDAYDPITVEIKPESRHQRKPSSGRRKHVFNEISAKEETVNEPWRQTSTLPLPRRRTPFSRLYQNTTAVNQAEERPVLELFNKDNVTPHLQRQDTDIPKNVRKSRKARSNYRMEEEVKQIGNVTNMDHKQSKKDIQRPRRVKYRSRRYELPTVASQMKQAGMRYYYDSTNHTNIPFVVTKSTAPSHNIGVNIQQVLNGLKIQQPLSGIPPTIAHHMGLGHMPTYGTKSAALVPALDNREINVIKVGRRLLRLPSYKYVSYNRLLSLYSEGDGMVPRFLRAMSRPHYFYTSMYNLATNQDDLDGATSKGRATSQEAKQNLTEFANLYREYENLNKRIKEGNYDPELEHRMEQLTRELAAREQNIHKVVQDYRTSLDNEQPLRASASTAEEGYRHSSYKIGDTQ